MDPVVIGQSFAWLHEAPGDVGVIICPGIGRDLRHPYRSMYALAGLLQSAGYPVLRLHYAGIGNSGDDFETPLFEAWLHDVGNAFDWVSRHIGSDKVVLCGFRLGALLIAHMTDRLPAASIFLQPIASGKSLLRELHAWNAIQGFSNQMVDAVWENEDLRLREIDRQSLAARSMAKQNLVAPHNLIVTNGSFAGPFQNRRQDGPPGGAIQVVQSSMYDSVMEPFERSAVPWTDFETIRDWLEERLPPANRPMPPVEARTSTLSGPAWRERAVELGAGPKIRGILCEPIGRTSAGTRAVVIGNLANDPQFGVGRFAVKLARRLASDGLSVLRIDYLGVGDSDDLPNGRQGFIYATSRDSEFCAAVDWLEAQGFTDIGVAGHCSGAYQAFRATVIDRRVQFAVLINIVVLRWGYKGSYADYLASRRNRVDAAIRFGMRLVRQWPVRLYLRRTMRDLARRRVKVWVISGEEDHSRRDIECCFRARQPRREGSTAFELITVPGTNHLISTRSMRRRVVDTIAREVFFRSSGPKTLT